MEAPCFCYKLRLEFNACDASSSQMHTFTIETHLLVRAMDPGAANQIRKRMPDILILYEMAMPQSFERSLERSRCLPPQDHFSHLLIWEPKGAHQTKSVLGYVGSYKSICAKASWQPVQKYPGCCNLQSKINTSVPANLPGAVNYNRKQRIL